MTRKVLGLAVLIVALAAMPTLAGDAGKAVKLTGWIVDSYCGAKNANSDGAACVRSCNKSGADLVLSTGGKIYKLSDQRLAKDNIGHEVEVSGTIDGETIKVGAITKAAKKA